jgi:hypothetical protein
MVRETSVSPGAAAPATCAAMCAVMPATSSPRGSARYRARQFPAPVWWAPGMVGASAGFQSAVTIAAAAARPNETTLAAVRRRWNRFQGRS